MKDFDADSEGEDQDSVADRMLRKWRPGEPLYRYELGLHQARDVVGLLVSGGLDSSILLKHMLDSGQRIKPFYIRSGLCWQTVEQQRLERYLNAVAVPHLERLTIFDLPVGDVYGDHWSITGRDIPQAGTLDEAVFLPGRNALLTIKTVLWCQLHGIGELAIATLRSNPFEDASATFFEQWGEVLSRVGLKPIRLVRPFGALEKRQVMAIGRTFPLELTFSCIAPRGTAHCGECNKCAERQEAFRLVGWEDPTEYSCATTSSLMIDDESVTMLQEAKRMTRDFHVGDHVEWNSEAGRVRGTIKKRITSKIKFKGYHVHASKEEPQYLIKSDTTAHLAMHKGSALTKLKKAAG